MCHKETAEGGLEFFLGVSMEREKTTNIQSPRAGNTCEFEGQAKRSSGGAHEEEGGGEMQPSKRP